MKSRKKSFRIIGIIVALGLIVMFCFLGYRLNYKKDIEKLAPAASK